METGTQDILNINEAAELLRVSVKTLRRHINSVPQVKLGGKYLFSREAISAYVRGAAPTRPAKVTHPKADF